jgi:signal transduction histidine kinase
MCMLCSISFHRASHGQAIRLPEQVSILGRTAQPQFQSFAHSPVSWPKRSRTGHNQTGITRERKSKPESEEVPLPSFRLLLALEGVAVMQQALPKQRLSPAGTFQSRQGKHPLREPLSGLSRSVALISHDLRLPLTAILANAEFLAQSKLTVEEKDELYQEIRLAVDRMNEMVSSLVACAQNADTLQPARRSIVETVKRAIRMTSVRQEFRRISITHHHQGLTMGWFDSSRLERVVANLVLNACEAVSPESGQIVVSTAGNRACLQIEVWDNGPGIPAAIRPSVFQSFVSYGKTDGSGLGLAIARRIVEEHGGEIYFDGTCATGTLFKITIPFAAPQRPHPHIFASPIYAARARRDGAQCSLELTV